MVSSNRDLRQNLRRAFGGALLLTFAAAAFAQESTKLSVTDVLEEVLVTAQKRTESIQDVATSVSVFSGEKLEELHATQLTDYAAYLSGFNFQTDGRSVWTSGFDVSI